jgi:hypothetical protein
VKKELAKIEKKKELLMESFDFKPEDIKNHFCPNATMAELGLFLGICKAVRLNPYKREIYLVKYGTYPAEIVTGYETYLKRAERSGSYRGFKSWIEGNIEDGNAKACIDVYRDGWDKPFHWETEYVESVKYTKTGAVTKFWKPWRRQHKKCNISQAFRLVWPDEMDGLPYIREEIQDGEIIEAEAKEPIEQAEAITQEADNAGESQKFTQEFTKEKETKTPSKPNQHIGSKSLLDTTKPSGTAIGMSTPAQQTKLHTQGTLLWGKEGNAKLADGLVRNGMSEHTAELTLKEASAVIENMEELLEKKKSKDFLDGKKAEVTPEEAAKEAELKERLAPQTGKIKNTGKFGDVVDEVSGQDAIDRGNKFLHEETGMPLEE